MGIIEDFVARYRREYDFYDQAARLVAQQLEGRLQAAGVRAIVTFRAKGVSRLEPKVRARAIRKDYNTVEDIYADIPDLAGVRIALYFPAQRALVDGIVNELLVVKETKKFPEPGTSAKYAKRFGGYSATHYRVHLRDTSLVESQKRYGEARVEIQVASVLMHSWAEVEHDLVYKPYQGELSEDEYAILDELNGMVLAGEIALERLQRAGEGRVAAHGRKFTNHYELAAYLLRELSELASQDFLKDGLGDAELLFNLLAELNLLTPEAVERYLESIHSDLERRPIAEQIIDQILSEDSLRYELFQRLRASRASATGPIDPNLNEAMGEFLSAWISFERSLAEIAPFPASSHNHMIPAGRLIAMVFEHDPQTRTEAERLRRLRNHLVHGIEIPDATDLRDAAQLLGSIAPKTMGVRLPAQERRTQS